MNESRRRIIKKVDGGHGHHGGAWKVAYADFVTAMMALFMVMWLLASTDAQSRKEISNYFRAGILPDGDMSQNSAAQLTPSVIEESPVPPPPGQATLEKSKLDPQLELKERMKRLAASDPELAAVMKDVHMVETPEGIRIDTVDDGQDLLFETSSSKLKEPLERFLRAIAPIVANLHAPIEISGHTDARPYAAGSTMSNWDLSYQRAAAARQLFEANGMASDQIVAVVAKGSSELYVPNDPMASQNRRLSVLIKTVKHADAPAAGSAAAGSNQP